MTTLHVAAERGRFEIVKYLVGKGAGIDTKDDAGVSILDYNTDCNSLFKILYICCQCQDYTQLAATN